MAERRNRSGENKDNPRIVVKNIVVFDSSIRPENTAHPDAEQTETQEQAPKIKYEFINMNEPDEENFEESFNEDEESFSEDYNEADEELAFADDESFDAEPSEDEVYDENEIDEDEEAFSEEYYEEPEEFSEDSEEYFEEPEEYAEEDEAYEEDSESYDYEQDDEPEEQLPVNREEDTLNKYLAEDAFGDSDDEYEGLKEDYEAEEAYDEQPDEEVYESQPKRTYKERYQRSQYAQSMASDDEYEYYEEPEEDNSFLSKIIPLKGDSAAVLIRKFIILVILVLIIAVLIGFVMNSGGIGSGALIIGAAGSDFADAIKTIGGTI